MFLTIVFPNGDRLDLLSNEIYYRSDYSDFSRRIFEEEDFDQLKCYEGEIEIPMILAMVEMMGTVLFQQKTEEWLLERFLKVHPIEYRLLWVSDQLQNLATKKTLIRLQQHGVQFNVGGYLKQGKEFIERQFVDRYYSMNALLVPYRRGYWGGSWHYDRAIYILAFAHCLPYPLRFQVIPFWLDQRDQSLLNLPIDGRGWDEHEHIS